MKQQTHGTKRLQLDPPVPGDLDAVFAIASDPRSWTHVPGERVTDPAQTAGQLAMFSEGWQRDGLSHWAVRAAPGHAHPGMVPGQLLGTGGVHLFEAPSGTGLWNLGYRLDPACWGQGIATELALKAVGCARTVRDEVPVVARVLSTNPASSKVAQKAGLRLVWSGAAAEKTLASAGRDSVQRLIYADRALAPEILAWLVSRA